MKKLNNGLMKILKAILRHNDVGDNALQSNKQKGNEAMKKQL